MRARFDRMNRVQNLLNLFDEILRKANGRRDFMQKDFFFFYCRLSFSGNEPPVIVIYSFGLSHL